MHLTKLLLPLVVLAIISCTGATTETSDSEPDNILEGMKLKTIEGDKIDLSQYKSKTLVINFWATWCVPCIKEMPSLEKAKKALKEDDVIFLMVSNEPLGQIRKFLKTHDYALTFAKLDMPLEQLDIKGLPTTFIISKDGQLSFSETGAREWDTKENLQLIISSGQTERSPI
ncbi:TlpA disulfide reductase family protein [Fulvivirga sediminis]|uniref:TlpA family protein disulfide reductase n=1 Tax=Fulvivirga sediminis TaxID=2803949 RepID=A0A937FCR6_9BACT|nr:TlpA disulfide reductase family protein [Fulvivirga sediminis]MBL3658153.1 TlpA family protein disulfide reductase [Fulvivirga sediminis]